MKRVKYKHLEKWVHKHDARIVQAGHYPAQAVYLLEEDLKDLCKTFGLPRMGKLSGGRCYELEGEDFFAVFFIFKLGTGQEIGTIAHECYHATNFIYKRYGVHHSLTNDEPAAYLISHLAYYATKFLEEQGYGFTKLPAGTDAGTDTDSGDLRPELPSPQQGRVDAGAETTGRIGDPVLEAGKPAELPCGCTGRCTGHPEPRPDTDLTCEPTPKMRQCSRCGVEYFATHKHVCSKRDVMAWEAKHEQDS